MKSTRLLSVPLLALGVVLTGAAPAGAAPRDVLTGYFVIDSATFPTTPPETTGAVSRFSFSITATAYGDLPGTFTEHLDCSRVHDVVRCQGHATSLGEDGTVGEIHTHITCTPDLLRCSGHSKGRGVTPAGERVVWHTIVTPGDGVGLYETRVARP